MVLTRNAKTYVFDLDGVIYRGRELQPTARETIACLTKRGSNVWYYTNNSAKTRTSYRNKLAKLNIPTPLECIMTSAYATALYLSEKNAKGKSVYIIGGEGLFEELTEIGMNVYRGDECGNIKTDYVIVGIDRDFNYKKLTTAQYAILNGAEFIATNADPTFPLESGTLNPGGGSLVAAVATCSLKEPFVVGKPFTYAFEKILQATNTRPDEAVMIGDRLDTDIAVANRAGAYSALVLTGVTNRAEAESATGELKPTVIIDRLEELLQ